MPATTLSCPQCSATLKSGTPIPAGRKIRCPKCGAIFAASAEMPASSGLIVPAEPGLRELDDPIPERTGAENEPVVPRKVPSEEDDGKEVRVVRKKSRLSIPAEQVDDEESADDRSVEDDEEPIRRPLRRKKKRQSNSTKILAVTIGSALIVLLFVGGTAYFIWNNVVNKGRNKGTGKENPLAYIPADSSFVFGMDLAPLWSQPAVAAQIEKLAQQRPPNSPEESNFMADVKKGTGLEYPDFFDRLIFAMKMNFARPTDPPVMTVIIQSKVPFNQNKVRDSDKELIPHQAGGKTYYRRGTAGGRGPGWLFMPSDRIMVLSDLPEDQMKELVESGGVEPKLPASVVSTAEGLEKNLFWLVLPFSDALKEQMKKNQAVGGNNPPELQAVNEGFLQAKMLTLSSNVANGKVSLQVGLVCADESSAKQVANGVQNYWEKNSKGLAGMQVQMGLTFLPKELQAIVKEMLENLQFSSQGAIAQVSTQFTAPSAEAWAKLMTNLSAPRVMPGGAVPGGPPPGGFRQGPPGGFRKRGA
jgi:hypothetical protein